MFGWYRTKSVILSMGTCTRHIQLWFIQPLFLQHRYVSCTLKIDLLWQAEKLVNLIILVFRSDVLTWIGLAPHQPTYSFINNKSCEPGPYADLQFKAYPLSSILFWVLNPSLQTNEYNNQKRSKAMLSLRITGIYFVENNLSSNYSSLFELLF